jgi:alanyl-tRNA synthetase
MELWNHVTMRYQRRTDGSLEPLPQRGADFRYLHQTHGLPPELVTELLAQPTCDC